MERDTQLDTPMLIGDLRKHLKENQNAMAASFVCTYIVDEKPQPPDYATRYSGQVRLVIKLSTDDVVKSAHAIETLVCPFKR